MTQGYVFFGVDDRDKQRNINSAYALNATIKKSDPTRETCVIVHKFDQVPLRYENDFDYIVELPFGRSEVNHHDVRIDWWQVYNSTPFEQNIYVDLNTIAIDNISSLWDVANGNDLLFATPCDFRGNRITNDRRFQTQIKNDIAAFSADVVYFEQSEQASEFFKLADPVFKKWREIYYDIFTSVSVQDFDYTLLVNYVAKLSGQQMIHLPLFDYTDLTFDEGWSAERDDNVHWTENYNVWFTDNLELKINNHRQTGFVYYGESEFLTQEMFKKIDDYNSKNKKKKTS